MLAATTVQGTVLTTVLLPVMLLATSEIIM